MQEYVAIVVIEEMVCNCLFENLKIEIRQLYLQRIIRTSSKSSVCSRAIWAELRRPGFATLAVTASTQRDCRLGGP